MQKWEEQDQSQVILKRATAKRFIEIFIEGELIKEYDLDSHFKILEKIRVYDDKLFVSFLDGSEIEWKIELVE